MKSAFILFQFISIACQAQDVEAIVGKGNELYLKLKFDEAENQYRRAIQLAPNNVQAQYNLANALMQQKKYRESLQLFLDVATQADGSLKNAAYYNAGVNYTRQKDLENSIAMYKAALKVNSADKEARENLQKALTEQKRQQQQQQNSSGGGGGLSQKEVDKKLKELQEKEKDLQQRLQNRGNGGGGAKDW